MIPTRRVRRTLLLSITVLLVLTWPWRLTVCHESLKTNSYEKAWDVYMKEENNCVMSYFITVELYFGVYNSTVRVIERPRRSCAQSSTPIMYDPFQQKLVSKSVVHVDHLFSHPRYDTNMLRRSNVALLHFVDDVRRLIVEILNAAERSIVRHIISNTRNLKTNVAVPVLCGDYSKYSNSYSSKVLVFYSILRRTINHFRGSSPLRLYTNPLFCRSLTSVQKFIGDVIDASPHYFRQYMFNPEKAYNISFEPHLRISTALIIGSQYVIIAARTLEPNSAFDEVYTVSETDVVGVPNIHERWKIIRLVNLGLTRSHILLLRLYCLQPQFAKTKICLYPCFPKTWVQTPPGGVLRQNIFKSDRHLGVDTRDVYRLGTLCDKERPEMNVTHEKEFCTEFLKYNISDPNMFSRSRIPNCELIVGTGDARGCRKAIRDFLLSLETPVNMRPFSRHPTNFNAYGMSENFMINDIWLLGPFSRFIAESLSDPFFHISGLGGHEKTASPFFRPSYETELYALMKFSHAFCGETHMLKESLGVDLKTVYRCFLLSYILELLFSVGAHKRTTIRMSPRPRNFLGFIHLSHENNPTFLKNTFIGDEYHWREQPSA